MVTNFEIGELSIIGRSVTAVEAPEMLPIINILWPRLLDE